MADGVSVSGGEEVRHSMLFLLTNIVFLPLSTWVGPIPRPILFRFPKLCERGRTME